MKKKKNKVQDNIGSYVGSWAEVTTFYSDTKIGTKGRIIDHWIEKKHGVEWMTLYLGKNLSGEKMEKSFPFHCLTLIANPDGSDLF